jgi:hypothetical protein
MRDERGAEELAGAARAVVIFQLEIVPAFR